MKRLIAIVLTLGAVAGTWIALATSGGTKCGVERWSVKTLSDPAAAQVDFHRHYWRVSRLRSLPAPLSSWILFHSPRIAPLEYEAVTVRVDLVEMKQEADRDIHLVVADPSDPSTTMIVEFPDASCLGPASAQNQQRINSAKQAFLQAEGAPPASLSGGPDNPTQERLRSGFRPLSGQARITGVLFFDLKHAQTGVAPNAIELHPVTGFELLH